MTSTAYAGHGRAVALMVVASFLWSTAGVVTRHLDAARGLEITFWRSFFTLVSLGLILRLWRGPGLTRRLVSGGRYLWASGVCWAIMFTAFMIALTMTTVANVLVTMAIAPLLTALVARAASGHALPQRTWWAIVLAGVGIAGVFGGQVSGAASEGLAGLLVALCVPCAAAVNWTLVKKSASADMVPAILIGAGLSSLATLPLAWPLSASLHDIGWLAFLGLMQLAVPCSLAIVAARTLSAPEVSLLALLEIIFGIGLAWLGAGEDPDINVLLGGMLVISALAGNEWLGLRQARATGASYSASG
ncbi:MAG: DMT family transporter [Burkholderiaceae bacterium]|nr:DMT family transporter [Sulfuritalea sp.]MCF8174515.1 DMT family transporter [Burkholderiaceae bacterium]MCF8184838.1 DMT family transporter [Polynucleobacter sp.]